MVSLDKLTDLYNNWGDKQGLQPLGCAFEERYFHEKNKFNSQQLLWLERLSEFGNMQNIKNMRNNNGHSRKNKKEYLFLSEEKKQKFRWFVFQEPRKLF